MLENLYPTIAALLFIALFIIAATAQAEPHKNLANRQFPHSPMNLEGAEQANNARIGTDTIILDVVTESGRIVRAGDDLPEKSEQQASFTSAPPDPKRY